MDLVKFTAADRDDAFADLDAVESEIRAAFAKLRQATVALFNALERGDAFAAKLPDPEIPEPGALNVTIATATDDAERALTKDDLPPGYTMEECGDGLWRGVADGTPVCTGQHDAVLGTLLALAANKPKS